MYKITRRTINSSNTVLFTRENYIDCSKLDLEAIVIPTLQKLVNVFNTRYAVEGQNLHVDVIVEEIDAYNIFSFTKFMKEYVTEIVKSVNISIKMHNNAAKMSNRRNSRAINSNLLKELKLEDYINRDLSDMRKFEGTIVIK